ncbi:MAG: DUF1175 family protein [Terriglobia bacterium]
MLAISARFNIEFLVRQANHSRPWSRRFLLLLGLAGIVYGGTRLNPAPLARVNRKLEKTQGHLQSPASVLEASNHRVIQAENSGDGFPAGVRLDRAADRENFTRWMTFLAEAAYYHPGLPAKEEVQDCAALIRYAYRNALVAHTAAWRREAGLPFEPGFGDITEYSYPHWPLGPRLFRTRAGPFAPADLGSDTFSEFADARTLLQFNTFAVSRDVRAARPGDLLFFYQPQQAEPFHVILYVGRSNFQPQGADWIVYHTGDLDGKPGEVRHLQVALLMQHPDPRWRPLAANPHFLGVYRFDLLR